MKRNPLLIVILVIVGAGVFHYFISMANRSQSGEGSSSSVVEGKTEIMLYCGAGIRPAMNALITAFEKKGPIKVTANYAGSGRLLAQISAMQKGDLFMPGSEFYVERAIEKGLAYENTKRIVAYFVPVIFVKKGNPKNIKSLSDLKQKGLRLGFGDERSCAVGKKTLKILEKNKIDYSELQENVIYKSGTVNELGLAIQLGNVDAVILWDANARHFEKSGTVVNIPKEQNVTSAIPIVVLNSSEHSGEAKRFVDFITSREGRDILREKGYTVSLL